MLSTIELEHNIKTIIKAKLPNIEFEDINFCAYYDNSLEGIYVFSKNEKYHFIFIEKGKIREHKELFHVKEVLWNVLNVVLFDTAMKYAILNKRAGEDFRRQLFEKEIELFSLFGESFKETKVKEIQNILLKNPYTDIE